MRTAGLALLIAGCTAGDVVLHPSPWSYEPEPAGEPVLSEDAVAAAIAQWVPAFYAIDVDPLFDSYDAVNSYADGACPTLASYGEEPTLTTYWQGDCASASGALFNGYTQAASDEVLQDDGWLARSRYVYGVASVVAPEGWSWSLNGYFAASNGTHDAVDGDTVVHESYRGRDISADLVWDAPTAPAWMGSGATFTGAASIYEQEGIGRMVGLDGSVSGGLGDGVTALAISALQMPSRNFTGCPVLEPNGTVSVRDAEGGWYDVVFDAPLAFDAQTDLSLCDGCGDLWFEGARVGRVCVDLAAMVDTNVEAPW
jgi:hypothetical protein